MKTVARMASSVHHLCDTAAFGPTLRSIVGTVLGGIVASGSVVLSELLRPQVSNEGLHAAEQRLSHALKNETALDVLPEAYLERVAPIARTLRFRSIDGSDLSKPASRTLEALDVVRDGSAKPRDRVIVGDGGVRKADRASRPEGPPADASGADPQGARAARPKRRRADRAPHRRRTRTASRTAARAAMKAERNAARGAGAGAGKVERIKVPSPPALKKLGYWMIQIEAGDGKGNHLPLYQDLFSTLDSTYQALGQSAWTQTFQQALERVLRHVGRDGMWTMDRGFDDAAWMRWMHERVEQYVIRLKRDRRVHLGTRQAPTVKVGTMANDLDAKHAADVRYVDRCSHQEKRRRVTFTWAPVWIDDVDHAQYLIVVHTGRKNPLLLVTNRRPTNAAEAGALIQGYLERWGNEETTRACKQLTGLERLRVRTRCAQRRLVWLAMIAVGLQAWSILTWGRLTRATLDRAKEFIKKVRFVLYRVWRVVQQDVLSALKANPLRFAS
jgi:hypothetical protein